VSTSSHQADLFSYWVVKTYDKDEKSFNEDYKSYGVNEANKRLIYLLGKGICAVIERRRLPMI
jgi:hypothetical protein